MLISLRNEIYTSNCPLAIIQYFVTIHYLKDMFIHSHQLIV